MNAPTGFISYSRARWMNFISQFSLTQQEKNLANDNGITTINEFFTDDNNTKIHFPRREGPADVFAVSLREQLEQKSAGKLNKVEYVDLM